MKPSPPTARQLLIILFFRLLLNIGRRFVYPFAPALGRDLGVPLTAITSVIAASQFTSLFGLFSGPVADRIGNRFVMRSGLALLFAGMLVCALIPTYWFLFVGLLLASFGKTIFDPAIQSYIGNHVPYHRRGRVIGVIETAWAGTTLLGIPAMGLIIDQYGLRVSYWVLALFAGVSWYTIVWVIPPDSRKQGSKILDRKVFSSLVSLIKIRPAAGMLAFGFWISIANDAIFVTYGVWAEQAFMVSLVTLGFSTIAIGLAELAGETVTALFSDRLGLKKTLIFSSLFASFAYLLLPLVGMSFTLAMAGMFLIFFFFETTMVTSFSLSTEILPQSRATMMSGFYAASGIGRMVGVLLGGIGWQLGGIRTVAWGAAICTLLGLVSLFWGLKGWRSEVESSKGSGGLS